MICSKTANINQGVRHLPLLLENGFNYIAHDSEGVRAAVKLLEETVI